MFNCPQSWAVSKAPVYDCIYCKEVGHCGRIQLSLWGERKEEGRNIRNNIIAFSLQSNEMGKRNHHNLLRNTEKIQLSKRD